MSIYSDDKPAGSDGSGAQKGFRAKIREYTDCYYGANPMTFMPLALSASGLMHQLSLDFIQALVSSPTQGSAQATSLTLRKVLGSVARALQRGNANLFRSYA